MSETKDKDKEKAERIQQLREQQLKAEAETLARLRELGEQQVRWEEETLSRFKKEREQRRIASTSTWEEETMARLRNAIDQQKRAEEELARWTDYRKALERSLDYDKRIRGISGFGKSIDPESLRKKSVRNALFEIAAMNDGVLVAANATQILLEAGISKDREHIRGLIYSTIYHNKRFFKKERPGHYRVASVPDASSNPE
ncbi:MAG: hypothetical protein WC562_05630 [Dehalococcoidia bacterium]